MAFGPSSSAFVSFLSYHWLLIVATSFVNGPLSIEYFACISADIPAALCRCHVSHVSVQDAESVTPHIIALALSPDCHERIGWEMIL